jgi:hypothetical protein
MKLKEMTVQALALRMIDYIVRIEKLMDKVYDILSSRKLVEEDAIRNSYKKLKEEIKADAHYVSLAKNKDYENHFYSEHFSPSVLEAAAFGFMAYANSSINQKFFNAIEEAHYKLTKELSLEKLKRIADGMELYEVLKD